MNIIKTKIMILFALVMILPGCGNDKSETIKETKTVKEVSRISPKKKKKKDKPQKNATVKVEATINGKKIDFDKIDPKYNSIVVLFNESFELKYVDMKNQLILIHLYDSKLYQSTPITFSTQIASLPPKEQALVKVKSSKLSFTIPGTKPGSLHIKELYNGEVILKEFTEERIVILFEGQGFPVGVNQGKSKLFPMKGKIVIENYNTYDSRR